MNVRERGLSGGLGLAEPLTVYSSARQLKHGLALLVSVEHAHAHPLATLLGRGRGRAQAPHLQVFVGELFGLRHQRVVRVSRAGFARVARAVLLVQPQTAVTVLTSHRLKTTKKV